MRNLTARTTRTKTAVASGAMMIAVAGLAGCGSESAGPEQGEVTTDDLTQLEDQIGALEDRVGALEEGLGDAAAGDAAAGEGDIVGQEVTVSAEISELITSTDAGSAFRIAGGEGPSVAVLSGGMVPEGLQVDDVVQISGTVQMINRETFEQDFGIAEDELFEDPDAFFEENEGQPAIAADQIEVLQEQAQE